jgi:hypothetical protein
MAALVAAYGARLLLGSKAWMEVVLMIEPPGGICFNAAREK